MTRQEKIEKAYEIFLFGAILLITGLIVYTNLFHYCYKMNADIASEAVLARHIWESGEWLPKSWFPSTEYRIFSSANLAALFYGIFQDMALAMGCACSVLTFGVLGSLYFFISQFSFRRADKLLFLLLCLILPSHFTMLEVFYLFGAYYAVHVILLFLSLGVYVKLIGGGVTSAVWQLLLILFSFIVGMQGMRGILVLNMPMLVTEAVRQGSLLYEKTWKKRDTYTAGWCVLMMLAGYIGTCMPFSIGVETTRNIRKGLVKLWETVLPEMFDALGFAGMYGIRRAVPVILLLISVGVLCGYVVCILKKRGRDPVIWAYILMWMSLGVTMAAAAFTTTQTSVRYYFVILPAVALGVVCFVRAVREKRRILRIVGGAASLFLLVFQLRTVYLPILRSEEPAPSEEYEVCRYLAEHDYGIAYAVFDKGNVITVLSDGAVRGAAVSSVESMEMCKWLSSTDWYRPNLPYRQRTAYIVSETDREAFERFRAQHEEEIRLETQIGYLYLYGSDYNLSGLGEL